MTLYFTPFTNFKGELIMENIDKINFYSKKEHTCIAVPISECYKVRNRKKTKEGFSYEFAVKTVTFNGVSIKKNISRDNFELLRCRMVQY